MARPASDADAVRLAHRLLAHSQPGRRCGAVRDHLDRSTIIAAAIWKRFKVGPYQWKVKHIRWFLDCYSAEYPDDLIQKYWTTVVSLAVALGKLKNWSQHVKKGRFLPSIPNDDQSDQAEGALRVPGGPERSRARSALTQPIRKRRRKSPFAEIATVDGAGIEGKKLTDRLI